MARNNGRFDLSVSNISVPLPMSKESDMPGSLTTPGLPYARHSAYVSMAFRFRYSVGIREGGSFAAQWLAYTLPYRRFARILADTNARLGANVVRYTFIAMYFHHLLLAGLYRRTPKNRSWTGCWCEFICTIKRLYANKFAPTGRSTEVSRMNTFNNMRTDRDKKKS